MAERRGALHHHIARIVEMLGEMLGGEVGHVEIGAMNALSSVETQREGKTLLHLLARRRAQIAVSHVGQDPMVRIRLARRSLEDPAD